MVDIIVGPEQKIFHLHRDLLCQRSVYFQACFEDHSEKAEANEHMLPGDSAESFGLFVVWLYGASLMSIPSEEDLSVYLDLVILAEKLCLEYLRNEATDHILRFYRTSPPKVAAHTIRAFYENTSVGDPLRKLVFRFVSWMAVVHKTTVFGPDETDLLKGGGELALHFTSMLAFYCFNTHGSHNHIKNMDPRRRSNCDFHKHNSTPVCAKPSR